MGPALQRLTDLPDATKLRRVRDLMAITARLHGVLAAVADLNHRETTTTHFAVGTATWLQHKTNTVSK